MKYTHIAVTFTITLMGIFEVTQCICVCMWGGVGCEKSHCISGWRSQKIDPRKVPLGKKKERKSTTRVRKDARREKDQEKT